MKIPLFRRLKKKAHVEVALLQDEVVDVVYTTSKNPVLHGGTAIWRCFEGNRFSEDLDFYCIEVGGDFKKNLSAELGKRGLSLLKYKRTENTIFAKVSDGSNEVRLEISLRKPLEKVVQLYEKADGSFIDVYSFSAEGLMREKMNAYLARRLARDFYDVYFLSSFADRKAVEKEALAFLEKAKEPADERTLKTVVLAGVTPTYVEMRNALEKKFQKQA